MIFKERIERRDYATTLEKIRDDPDSMYNGEIAETIIEDIRAKKGVMTLDDLKTYKVKEREPLTMKIGKLSLHTMPLPTGGPILIHILQICKGGYMAFFGSDSRMRHDFDQFRRSTGCFFLNNTIY